MIRFLAFSAGLGAAPKPQAWVARRGMGLGLAGRGRGGAGVCESRYCIGRVCARRRSD